VDRDADDGRARPVARSNQHVEPLVDACDHLGNGQGRVGIVSIHGHNDVLVGGKIDCRQEAAADCRAKAEIVRVVDEGEGYGSPVTPRDSPVESLLPSFTTISRNDIPIPGRPGPALAGPQRDSPLRCRPGSTTRTVCDPDVSRRDPGCAREGRDSADCPVDMAFSLHQLPMMQTTKCSLPGF